MRRFYFSIALVVATLLANMASAQQSVWIQIKSQRGLGAAEAAARRYAGKLESVAGFATRSGWYVVALGPFSPTQAQDALRQLRITRQIPADSYIVDGRAFGQQFWPPESDRQAASAAQASPSQPQTQAQAPAPTTPPQPAADETPAQARRSERALSRDERMAIQTALKWEGFYTSAIDGAFGPGTRKSMAAWQASEGLEPTGILTTAQRQKVVSRYQEALASLGIDIWADTTAGIKIALPMGLVEFDRYEPPFAHFKPKGDSGVKVLLISQSGDADTLRGLYDIMQTLEIVPLDGERSIKGNSFTITGQNGKIASYTYAILSNGQVKGFTLIWPQGDEKRRQLVLSAMKNSFEPIPDYVLPDVYGDTSGQSIDLLAGLVIRHPELSRTGFYVSDDGVVMTVAEAVQSCERITLDNEQQATVVARDEALGLALLRPQSPLAPLSVAHLRRSLPRLKSEIAIAGYSYEGALDAPTLTYGKLTDTKGLAGEVALARLSVEATEADSGGPVYDGTGAVIGTLLASKPIGTKRLPPNVRFAAKADALAQFLETQGITPQEAQSTTPMPPEDLTPIAEDMAVLVSCWN